MSSNSVRSENWESFTVRAGRGAAARPVRAGRRGTLLYDMNAYAERTLHLPLDVELEFSAGEGV
jgi:hypothetical protein